MQERMFQLERAMRAKVCAAAFWAILVTVAAGTLTGCVRVYTVKASVTAVPVFGAQDPEQPQTPPDHSGLIVSVTHERIAIQTSAQREDVEEAPSSASEEETESGESILFVPLAEDVSIRQSRGNGESAEFLTLQPYEIIPGLYADVWLNEEGGAAYIRVSVRMRLET